MPLAGPPLKAPVDVSRILGRGLEIHSSEAAIVSAERRWSWRQLDQASTRLAAKLLEIGLNAGDRVASLMPNCTELIVHYLACMKAGFVATPLNYRYMAPEIDHALTASGASVLVAHADRDEDLAASQLVGCLSKGVIRFAAEDRRTKSLETMLEEGPDKAELPNPDPPDPAAIFFTSGSTGKPKGVTHSFESLGWLFASGIQLLELNGDDAILPGSSISHIGGFGNAFIALAAGARVIIPRTFDGDELLPLLRGERPTVLIMLPAALIALVRDHNARREDFCSLRLCVSGGDKVSPELEGEFTDLAGIPVDEGYGMTEIGFATLNPPSGENRLGSVGRPGPGYSISIRDEQGAELPSGAEGRLWVKSPANTAGYWNNQKATDETILEGWLDTGDVMRVDDQGYLWFRGRKKQIIIHDGSNICPQEVEEALAGHEAVESAGVVGAHDLVHGENVRAYVTLKQGAARPSSQELIRFARKRVGYKAPEEIVMLDEMPLNATGKVDRVTLKQMAEPRVAGPNAD